MKKVFFVIALGIFSLLSCQKEEFTPLQTTTNAKLNASIAIQAQVDNHLISMNTVLSKILATKFHEYNRAITGLYFLENMDWYNEHYPNVYETMPDGTQIVTWPNWPSATVYGQNYNCSNMTVPQIYDVFFGVTSAELIAMNASLADMVALEAIHGEVDLFDYIELRQSRLAASGILDLSYFSLGSDPGTLRRKCHPNIAMVGVLKSAFSLSRGNVWGAGIAMVRTVNTLCKVCGCSDD